MIVLGILRQRYRHYNLVDDVEGLDILSGRQRQKLVDVRRQSQVIVQERLMDFG